MAHYADNAAVIAPGMPASIGKDAVARPLQP
jgi:hypothetical protein